MFELAYNDVDVGGEINAEALGLSVDDVAVGTLWLGTVVVRVWVEVP